MGSKLIIFVAFATLTKGPSAQQSRDYGLSEFESAQLLGIIDNQSKTLSANFLAVQSIFDLIEILSTARKYNLKLKDDAASPLVLGALRTAKNASDYTFNSIPLILGRACYYAEMAQKAAHGDLEDVYAQVGSAFGLARSGNYIDIRTQFGVFSFESQKYLENFTSRLYDTISSCIHNTNADILATIRDHEVESVKSLLRANDAVFDAIKVFAAGIPAEGDGVAVIPNIKVHREKAKLAVTNVVEHSYCIIRGLFISTRLNQLGNAVHLTSEQYAQIVRDWRVLETGQTLLSVIGSYLSKVQLGLSDGCNDDSSAIDVAEARTAANFRASIIALVESVPTTDPVTSTTVAAALEYFDKFVDYANAAYYNGIRLARGHQGLNFSETLNEIKTFKAGLRSTFPDYIHTLFEVVRVGSNMKSGPTTHEDNAIAAALIYVDRISDATRAMAEACYGTRAVTEDGFKMLRASTSELDSVTDTFNSDISIEQVSAIKTFATTPIPIVPSEFDILIVRPGIGFTFN